MTNKYEDCDYYKPLSRQKRINRRMRLRFNQWNTLEQPLPDFVHERWTDYPAGDDRQFCCFLPKTFVSLGQDILSHIQTFRGGTATNWYL